MGVYSKTVLESPNTVNISSSYSANQFTTNNGQTKAYNGMPGKDGVADHGTTFVLGRRVYSSYRKPDNIMTLEQLYKNQNVTTNIRYKQTSNSLIKSTQVEIGKPIADNSSGLYVNRRKHLAIGSGSTKPRTSDKTLQLKGGEDKNYKNQKLNYCKAGGSIAPNMTRIGPSQPSIFCRHSIR